MTNYSKYPYCRMLYFIESKCAKLKDERNYIKYILSVYHAKSLRDIINIYNNSYKFLAYLFFEKDKLHPGWYVTETWGHDCGRVIDDLNYCLNDSILKWLERQETPTEQQVLRCLSNLRHADNEYSVEKRILSFCTPKPDNGIGYLTRARTNLYLNRKKIEKGERDGWTKKHYISDFRYFAAHGRIFDIVEILVGKEIGMSFDNLVEQYKEELSEKEARKKELERKEKELQRKEDLIAFNDTIDTIAEPLFSALLSIPFGILGGIISSSIGKKR